ncbi:DNA polymerase IV [Aestuariirhabdus litorea]|uniref:DNA polymerase IV n=1 Tax=Aestuariirhabdus litorea TaxID=2528527 RepID=A0A3P3VMV1_9GAMM|nr:DNA polymerase IV [Aestuariirhabdus litorea]RRJ84015.1 DNA polymerase IV [Aestuariirhabdus litorea]RWW97235.1 DNA polymerase IV [Endozoicomonadaceae bacterium GTF-13]
MLPSLQRKIIHIDCDCFYAAIEMRDDPSLRGIPIAVGGSPDRRGVVATCNYEARRYGIHSAMAAATARKLCPSLRFIRPRMEAYREASREIHAIFADYSDRIEPLSLDEAYLDVSHCPRLQGSATRIAEQIRQRVRERVGITVSAGVAPNKFLAKVASDWNKPDGLFVVRPEQVDDFVEQLPVKRLHGVGRVTANKLKRLGIETCGQLRVFSQLDLVAYFGSFGERLFQLARGVDEREVQSIRRRKSLSVEHTFEQDLPSLEAVLERLPELLNELERRLEGKLSEGYALSKRFVKVKFADFTQTTLETLISGDPEQRLQALQFAPLMSQAWQRGARPVRLLGVGVRLRDLQQENTREQLSLF